MKAVIIGFLALVVIGGAGYAALHTYSKNNASPASNTQTQNTNTPSTPNTEQTANTITFDGSRFSPSTLTVASGTSVTIKNTSSQALQLDSNPHPVHTDDTDLNVGTVAAGQSQTFTVTKKGTFGYHDHLEAGIQGKITVQ